MDNNQVDINSSPLSLSQYGTQFFNLPFSIWIIIGSLFILHVLRQVYYYYKFFTSDAMSMLWKYLSFTKHVLPSFLVSIISGVRTINITFLADNLDANPAVKKLHSHPHRSTYHTFYTDVHGYKANFVIAIDTDDKVNAFRQIMMKFISDRITCGLLQRTVAEGVLQWVEQGTIDMIDLTMVLERIVMRFLYDIDPKETYTPEERRKRAQVFFEGTRWVLYDSYRPMGSLYAILWQNTGIDFDPVRRPVINALTEIWDDVYERQMEMIKKGKKCLLGEFMKDPLLASLDKEFIKANTIGAIMGGQFLTSISNITGMLYSMSNGDRPTKSQKANWILKKVSDWSPLISVLRRYEGFVMSIPSTGNSGELQRSFSLGQRQCPGKGMVLRAYGTLVGVMSKYNVSVEGLESTEIRCPLWPFVNPELRFSLEKLQQPEQKTGKGKAMSKLKTMRTMKPVNAVETPVNAKGKNVTKATRMARTKTFLHS